MEWDGMGSSPTPHESNERILTAGRRETRDARRLRRGEAYGGEKLTDSTLRRNRN